ncbi:MAG: DNA mismatch repair protein MutS [Oscillospiraceae bacterium]|nr:DNA mismatch repair protein MutS [Oscillospiraceae bacterium]
MAEATPMMRQYLQIKEQNPDRILFFRLGDFYEMFASDAVIASRELDLTLTTRDRGKEKEEQTPMCGVPYHSAESYIARLVAKGYKVAVCEQMEDPALTKGLVKRDIVRVVTPGTAMESSMLDERKNNYFACVFEENGSFGMAFGDISTGAFYATVTSGADACENELARFEPAEVLLGGEAAENTALKAMLTDRLHACVNVGTQEDFRAEKCVKAVVSQFGKPLAALGLDTEPLAALAAGALLETLKETQKSELSHIREMEFYRAGKFMQLDLTARRNLELTQTLRGKEKKGSLLWVLDKTGTAMGSRLLRSWLEKPLLSPALIEKRLSAVEELTKKTVDREELAALLREVSDLERVTARIVTGTANCRDLTALAAGAARLPEIRAILAKQDAGLLKIVCEQLDPLEDLKALIDRAIVDEPPFTVREGGMIREGFSAEVDQLRMIQKGGKGMLAGIEAEEKEKTGIKNLRVGYNRVFGYYIEVSKGQVDQVPDTYIRKQTLANGERYITEKLKELENTILTAQDRATALEYELFTQVRDEIAAASARILATAQAVATADVLTCFAQVAVQNRYCRPTVDLSDRLEIKDGRHPVVEQVLKDSLFVPNDTRLGGADCRAAIITGPNMAGKSTYMRQVALIVLMAQIGSFVPAASAHVGVVDRLFTRVGASDDLTSGQSTFMVEMNEVAEILRYATNRSLLILDEIGRGTSTFDGMAIARAVLEYAVNPKKIGAKTLFATHYHELTAMADELPGLKNFNIAVKKRQGEMIFLRKIVPGPAQASYGVEVAKLAGLPDPVIARARTLLAQLESGEAPAAHAAPAVQADDQLSLDAMDGAELRRRLEELSPETLTPIEALNLLYELKQLLN